MDKIFRDKQGKIVLYQRPKAPIIVWAVMSLTAILVHSRLISHTARIIATVALVVWCLLEIFRGVNYFRRGLGVVVLTLTVFSLAKALIL